MAPTSNPFMTKYGYFSSHPLVGYVTKSEGDVKIASDYLSGLSGMAALEFLAKVIAFRFLREGTEIPGYRVDAVFELTRNFPAFGLVGKNSAILLFRGTDVRWQGRSSIWADFDFKGPGFSLYLKNHPQLSLWLKGKNAVALGHSLGGALATCAALFDHVPAIAFSAPGLYKKTLKEWEVISHKIPVTHYVVPGDPISRVGHLVGSVHQLEPPHKLKPIEAHTSLMF